MQCLLNVYCNVIFKLALFLMCLPPHNYSHRKVFPPPVSFTCRMRVDIEVQEKERRKQRSGKKSKSVTLNILALILEKIV